MFLNYFKINLIITFIAVFLPTLNGMLGKEVVENEKKHVLFIAPNFIPYHFEMASRCADLLAKDYYVHFVILRTGKYEMSDYFDYGVDKKKFGFSLRKESRNTYEIVTLDKRDIKIENEEGRIFHSQSYTAFRDILSNKHQFINRLINRKYDLAFFDTVDIGALYLFHLAAIKNVFGINYTQNLQYGYLFDKNLNPKINQDGTSNTNQKMKEIEINDDSQTMASIYTSVHNIMDNIFVNFLNEFKQDGKGNNHPELKLAEQAQGKVEGIGEGTSKGTSKVKVEDLYLKIKGIFINNDKLLGNFPIEDKKSVNLHYVGGFHLNDVKELRNKVNDSYLKSHGKPSKVIINLDYCEEIITLLDDIVNIFIDVVEDVTNNLEGKNKVNFIYNCHLKDKEDNSDNFKIAHIPIMQEELSK
uniref:Uncharacterized protein n=1 Tax=Meloidogyne enterolobii TaxID=390850 RepID=A0A6V7UB86_MELEN|nr:unnamed protein product [Meloidogyne enterolobii]